MKPRRSNLISPYEAIATPMTIRDILASMRRLGGAMPKAQVARRVATAFVAWMWSEMDFKSECSDLLSAFG